jgi:hypothetical protein
LQFDLDRELSEWLACLKRATNHSDTVQFAKLEARYRLDPGVEPLLSATLLQITG